MEKNAAFTIFTFLLFAVSAAHIAVDPSAIDRFAVRSDDTSKSTMTSRQHAFAADSNILLPSEKPKSDSDENDADDSLPDSEEPQMLTVDTLDSAPDSNLARFLTINRHFDHKRIRFVHRQPSQQIVRPFMKHRTEILYGDDVILPGKTDNFVPKTFRGQALKLKHQESNGRHRHHHQGDGDRFTQKYVFDREKLKSLSRHHKEEKREEEDGFMKRIRKFLRHSLD